MPQAPASMELPPVDGRKWLGPTERSDVTEAASMELPPVDGRKAQFS